MADPSPSAWGRQRLNMKSATESLEQLIQEHLAPWKGAHVELAIYGFAEPAALARELERCCRELLQVGLKAGLFYQSSIGSVAGIELEDARRVVLKAYQPDRSLARLREVVRLQRLLSAPGYLAPSVLAGPAPFARGHVVIEEYVQRGQTRDGHEALVRRGLAGSLAALIARLEPFAAESSLPAHAIAELAPDVLWPRPHSKLFDFEATRAGAEQIDALAASARRRMLPAGRAVIGHSDWRAEHVRFEGDLPVAAFDWDSLCKGREPALVGFSAHAFCADWSRNGHVQAPTLEEARAFVRDYEASSGHTFDPQERRLLGASFGYSVAYSARCGHAYGKRERDQPGTFHELCARHGEQLLEL